VPSRNPKHLWSQAERRAALRSKLIKKFSAQVRSHSYERHTIWTSLLHIAFGPPLTSFTATVGNTCLLQAPVYENCRMLSRDGDLLCFCDRAKVNWYLERGLAGQLRRRRSVTGILCLCVYIAYLQPSAGCGFVLALPCNNQIDRKTEL
jgi:hypothetical protein